jgi:RNA polymerase sigma-70 factor (ECF subfamily)
MPPHLTWFAGRDAVVRFLGAVVFRRASAVRVIPARVNGQPALATYIAGADGLHHPHSLQILTVTPTGVSRIVSFHDAGLFELSGLPASLDRPVSG